MLIFAPETRSAAAPYVICGLLGAASFSLLPCALEYLVEITYPISPEISSSTAWALGNLLGALFVVIMDALKDGWPGQPAGNMKRALVFQAVISVMAVPLPLSMGWLVKEKVGLRRQRTGRETDD